MDTRLVGWDEMNRSFHAEAGAYEVIVLLNVSAYGHPGTESAGRVMLISL